MQNESFKQLIKFHIWHVFTDGKIGKEWRLPKNYPKEPIEGFTGKQAFLLGMTMGQLLRRKENDDFTKIYVIDDINIKISKLIITVIAKIPWDSVEWEPNEETKQAIQDAKDGKDLKEFSSLDELFEDLKL